MSNTIFRKMRLDRIIAAVEPGMFATCEVHDLNGSFELVVADESADYECSLDRLFCEQYGITVGD